MMNWVYRNECKRYCLVLETQVMLLLRIEIPCDIVPFLYDLGILSEQNLCGTC